MRFLARLGLGLCGLALSASPGVMADDGPAPIMDAGPQQQQRQQQQMVQAAGHHHKGLFGWRHCVECQRAMAKKRDGVDVPPPPAMIPASVMAGKAVDSHGNVVACDACQAGTVVTGPVTVVESYPAGHAAVGGPTPVGNSAAGYAVVGESYGPAMAGNDPAPVGVSAAGGAHWNAPKMAQAGPRMGAGPYDPSVMPSSMIPAQTALSNPSAGRPHIISHLFGVGGIRRHMRETREDKEREAHAAISYNPPNQQVNEVPASLVYGKGH
jgi:hypothetical protein